MWVGEWEGVTNTVLITVSFLSLSAISRLWVPHATPVQSFSYWIKFYRILQIHPSIGILVNIWDASSFWLLKHCGYAHPVSWGPCAWVSLTNTPRSWNYQSPRGHAKLFSKVVVPNDTWPGVYANFLCLQIRWHLVLLDFEFLLSYRYASLCRFNLYY